MIRNIIWDADGTLFDTYPAIASAFQAAMADLGVNAPLDWIQSLAKKSVGMCETTLAEHYQLERRVDRPEFRRALRSHPAGGPAGLPRRGRRLRIYLFGWREECDRDPSQDAWGQWNCWRPTICQIGLPEP